MIKGVSTWLIQSWGQLVEESDEEYINNNEIINKQPLHTVDIMTFLPIVKNLCEINFGDLNL